MPEQLLPPPLVTVRARYQDIYAIVSPPRCSSTAFARVFWEQPAVRYYCHEPFEVTYYLGQGLDEVTARIESPLDLEGLKSVAGHSNGRSLVIKDMPYQLGQHFPLLVALANHPIIFLMRDPRLSIASRMAKKREVGDNPIYPWIESGWELWQSQVDWCRHRNVPHILVDSGDFRSRPEEIFSQVFEQVGLPFSAAMLEWKPCPDIELDNLGGKHRHLYGAVLISDGIQPDDTPIPPLEHFPTDNGWRDHVEHCLAIYRHHADSPSRVCLDRTSAKTGAGY